MKLNLIGNLPDAIENIMDLQKDYGFDISTDGICIKVERAENTIEVRKDIFGGYIQYADKIHFFRALGLFVENSKKQSNISFTIKEEPQFKTAGLMIDCSRNSVLKVDTIKSIIRKMAFMGLNMLMLYTEDTYEIEGEPYFGYMRGKYTYDEIMECDDYAHSFGIEMIPCIQTLAHMYPAFKWDVYAEIRDNDELLMSGLKTHQFMVGSEKTYLFIEKMMKAVMAPYRSKRIHIGMDEAVGLGLGQYLRNHGYTESHKIMLYHLKRVYEITKKMNLRPMMWSDMLLKCGSKKHEYYDPDAIVPQEMLNEMPPVDLVYWDYDNTDENFIIDLIKKHKLTGNDPLFAGGIRAWGSFGVNYEYTFKNTNAALNACKKEKVKEVFATVWANDGAESNIYSSMLGMQLFAEHSYSADISYNKLAERTLFCTGISYEAYLCLDKLDNISLDVNNKYPYTNTSKFLLWQDILLGLFDFDIQHKNLNEYYSSLEKLFKDYTGTEGNAAEAFNVPEALCAVLSIKSEIGIQIRSLYLNKDIEGLRSVINNELTELIQRIKRLRDLHREQWFKFYKPFGWEVLDIRYGGLNNRVWSVIERLNNYINGKTELIEELEEERLPYSKCADHYGDNGLRYYKRIASPGLIVY